MSTVFILGAGASYGDDILVRDEKDPATPTKPPLICGFFRKELFESIQYKPEQAEGDYPDAFRWIRSQVPETGDKPVGAQPWGQVNLEEIFTGVELRREFESPESDAGAMLRIIRNQLIAYIAQILGMCTQNCCGKYARKLVSNLEPHDSLFTFNWDLLLDEAFTTISPTQVHLRNFLGTRYASTNEGIDSNSGSGLFLKLHGSLNWFLCTNPKCKFAFEIQIDLDTQYCLLRAAKGRAVTDTFVVETACSHCGSSTIPLIVPPLVRKPITDDTTIRSVWGLARKKMKAAERIVLIGFSAAPTDFFVSWLLRSTVLDKPRTQVIVVNPLNEPSAAGHQDFISRIAKLFPYGFDKKFLGFSEIDKFS